jgi:hypothetical protein
LIELLKHKTVLYPEDDLVTRSLYEEYFKIFFKTVYLAENGQQAIEIYHDHKPDVIFLDRKTNRRTHSRRPRLVISILILILISLLSACSQNSISQKSSSQALKLYSTNIPEFSLQSISSKINSDERHKFRELFCQLLKKNKNDTNNNVKNYTIDNCSLFLHKLSDEAVSQTESDNIPYGENKELNASIKNYRFLFVSGIFDDCVSGFLNFYQNEFKQLRQMGFNINKIPINGLSGNDYNAHLINQYLTDHPVEKNVKTILIGYSKGIDDILHFIVNYPEQVTTIHAITSLGGAVYGSVLSQDANGLFNLIAPLIPEFLCKPGDLKAVESLTLDKTQKWMDLHHLPESINYYSLVSFTKRSNITWILGASYDKLSQIDTRNDGQLIFYHQVIPGSKLLAYLNVDHWQLAFDIENDIPLLKTQRERGTDFPRKELLEALFLFIISDLR